MKTKDILEERKSTHGDFSENSYISQYLKCLVRSGSSYPMLSDVQEEALDMICHKIARIVAGDPNHKDHWDDIAGYAVLASDRIEKND